MNHCPHCYSPRGYYRSSGRCVDCGSMARFGLDPIAPVQRVGVNELAQGSVVVGAALGTTLSAVAISAMGGKYLMLIAPVLGLVLAVPIAIAGGIIAQGLGPISMTPKAT